MWLADLKSCQTVMSPITGKLDYIRYIDSLIRCAKERTWLITPAAWFAVSSSKHNSIALHYFSSQTPISCPQLPEVITRNSSTLFESGRIFICQLMVTLMFVLICTVCLIKYAHCLVLCYDVVMWSVLSGFVGAAVILQFVIDLFNYINL